MAVPFQIYFFRKISVFERNVMLCKSKPCNLVGIQEQLVGDEYTIEKANSRILAFECGNT